MGKIFRRGIDFSGGGGSISNPTAASVTFDNTDTGLAAVNVQDAVTEVNGKLCNNYRETDTVSVDTVFPFVPEFTGIFFGLVNWSNNDGYILVLDENGSGLGSAQTTNGSPATLIFPFEKGQKILLGTHRNINGFYSISKVQFK